MGKGPAPQNPNRWGGQVNTQAQYLSQPSNEQANQHLTKIFKKAVANTCELIVKKNKEDKDVKNIKEAMNTSKIQLKSELVEKINKGETTETIAASSNDKQIYDSIANSLMENGQPWLEEIKTSKATSHDFDVWKELSLVKLRNLSNLARVYIDQESGIIKEIIDQKNVLLIWFKDVYLPLRIMSRTQKDQEVKYELDLSSNIESLDKNICLFLNEITGHGHLYCEKAQEQRIEVRQALLTACLETLCAQSQNSGNISKLGVLEQAQLVSCLMIIQQLINQYNQFEYNRVILSRDCYAKSIKFLFEYQGNKRFVEIINSILG